MRESGTDPVRVAIITDHRESGDVLTTRLSSQGMVVVRVQELYELAEYGAGNTDADVILVRCRQYPSASLVNDVIASACVPVLFDLCASRDVDGKATGTIEKIRILDRSAVRQGSKEGSQLLVTRNGAASSLRGGQAGEERGAEGRSIYEAIPPREVWVLCASTGGPQATARFLSRLPGDLPLCFILVQHVGESFVRLLAEQISRVTPLRVSLTETDRAIQSGILLVALPSHRFQISGDGYIEILASGWSGPYKPSFDDVLSAVSQHYGGCAGAIMFSGVGRDGIYGCRQVQHHGGVVWTQSADSCFANSLPDAVRRTGVASYSANPEDLALHLVERCRADTPGVAAHQMRETFIR
jgi:chemosensory pili system protein ChpB (putative protein-glutamate methylesterase)